MGFTPFYSGDMGYTNSDGGFARRSKVPWKECNQMDERLKFIAQLRRSAVSSASHARPGTRSSSAIGTAAKKAAGAEREASRTQSEAAEMIKCGL
jgi:hypothetical protein